VAAAARVREAISVVRPDGDARTAPCGRRGGRVCERTGHRTRRWRAPLRPNRRRRRPLANVAPGGSSGCPSTSRVRGALRRSSSRGRGSCTGVPQPTLDSDMRRMRSWISFGTGGRPAGRPGSRAWRRTVGGRAGRSKAERPTARTTYARSAMVAGCTGISGGTGRAGTGRTGRRAPCPISGSTDPRNHSGRIRRCRRSGGPSTRCAPRLRSERARSGRAAHASKVFSSLPS
jgi:hypothetical protein